MLGQEAGGEACGIQTQRGELSENQKGPNRNLDSQLPGQFGDTAQSPWEPQTLIHLSCFWKIMWLTHTACSIDINVQRSSPMDGN